MIRPGEFTETEWQQVRNFYAAYPAATVDLWKPLTHPREKEDSVPVPQGLGNQTLADQGYLDVTAAPFLVDNSGQTDVTETLQSAIDYARDYRLVAYLPAGDYLVSDTLEMRQLVVKAANGSLSVPDGRYVNALEGSRSQVGRRSRIILKNSSPGFQNPAQPKVVVYFYNTYPPASASDTPQPSWSVHYNQTLVGIDIKIGADNSGAVALRHRGAEGCTIQDVTLDLSESGMTGLWEAPASGGSTHKLTVIGGRIGIETRTFPDLDVGGTQPSPSFSQVRLLGQSEYALTCSVRGSLVMTGFAIVSARRVRSSTCARTGRASLSTAP